MKNLHRCVGFILGLLWLLIAGVAKAGDYEIIMGKGEELCEACLRNLLRQTAEEAVCDRRYAPELGFGQPDWNVLDLEKQVELYKRVANLVIQGKEEGKEGVPQPNLRIPKEHDEFIRVTRQTRTTLSAANIDIDNDGQLDRVLKYQSGNCEKNFHGYYPGLYKSALVVVVGDQRAIDYPKSDPLTQAPLLEDTKAKYKDKWRIGVSHFRMYQVFTYRGLVYFDLWDGSGGPDTNTLSIYEAKQGQARKVCQISLFPAGDVPHN
ncbi:MAG: hypothetical protein OEY28_10180 [Nitrospira sp.]|nr:hypothetical protein [Nitrospira sp.]